MKVIRTIIFYLRIIFVVSVPVLFEIITKSEWYILLLIISIFCILEDLIRKGEIDNGYINPDTANKDDRS